MLFMDFDVRVDGLVGYIPIPENVKFEMLTKESEGKIPYCEIVNLDECMNSPLTDEVEVNGMNLKEIIRNEYEKES